MAAYNIPMNVNVPNIESPLEAQARGLSLKQMTQGVELNAGKIKEEAAKAKAREEDLADEQVIQRAFTDNGGDHDKIREAIAPKVRMRNLQRWDKDHLDQQRAVLGLANEKRISTDTTNKILGSEAAGLLQVPYEQRGALLPEAIGRLAKSGIDTAQLQGFDPTDDNLKSVAARANYLGVLLSHADKIAQEEQRKAAAKRATEQAEALDAKEKAAARQQKIEDATRLHLGVTNQEQHAEWLKGLDKDIAPLFQNLKEFNKGTQTAVQRIALTGQQRQADVAREQAEADRQAARDEQADYRRDSLDLRKQIADQNAAFKQAALDLKADPNRPKLTPGQVKVEERNINSVEYGTANRPGLHAKRLQLGQELKSGKDTKGNDIDRDKVASELEAVNQNLQNAQFRKADLYRIEKPEVADVDAAKDGGEIQASDGSIWRKKSGVAFFERMAGTPATAGQSAKQPTATPSPSAQPQVKPAVATSGTPKVGTVSKGYRFKGGDPSVKENWELVR